MNKIIGLMLVSLMSFSTQAQKLNKLAIGSTYHTADKEMLDVISDGKYSLKSLQKKNGLLVIFTCNTCPFVIKNQERTREMLQFAERNEVGVALLNSNEAQREKEDSEDAMKVYGQEQDYPNYLIDKNHTLADYFGAGHTPEVYLFNAEGNLVYLGAMDDSPADPSAARQMYLKEAISKSVEGKVIEPNTTKSLGCSIKRLK